MGHLIVLLKAFSCLIVSLSVCARRFAYSNEFDGYAGSSVATRRASLAGQVSAEGPDEVYPTTPCLV